MHGIIMEDYIKEQDRSVKNKEIKFNLIKIYFILLLLSSGIIYSYYRYQNIDLNILIPYTVIWPISLILVGISMFKVKSMASFSLGFFITAISVGLTIIFTFIYSADIKTNSDIKSILLNEPKQIVLNIDLLSTNSKIRSDNNILLGDFSSNYDIGKINSYKDENNIENIQISQKSFPPGIGGYNKYANIVIPQSIPTIYDINMNLVKSTIDLSKMDLISGSFDIHNSQVKITIQNLDIKNDSKLDIKSRLSSIEIFIAKDIEVDLIKTSRFSRIDLGGMERLETENNKVYRTETDLKDESKKNEKEPVNLVKKKLFINLNSTLSDIKITQK